MSKAIKFIDDVYLDSDSVVFKKQKLTDILMHSTKERVIGTWEKRDGTIVKLYSKTIYIDSLPNAKEVQYDLGIENLDYVTKFYGSALLPNSHSYQMSLPGVNTSDPTRNVSVGIDNRNYLLIGAGTDRSTWWGQITIEYIKTKD